jgi:8-oxo-dGTP diphosphatase
MSYMVPRIGVGVIVRKDGKVLLGRRKGAHGEGSWQFPGGKLDKWESVAECAKRETREECGIEITNVRRLTFTEDHFNDDDKHFITLYVVSDWLSGEPQVQEPDKQESLGWYAWDELPQPLFLPIQNLVAQNLNPFDETLQPAGS